MTKILGGIMTVGGAIALVLGVLGAFGTMEMGSGTWPCIILGVIFFFAGVSIMKYQAQGNQES
ncbi:hypothetical protein [Nonlabens ponticola]|uniref:Uncharacterized protein n=1 Tax=Nonlabens ponticola TaxID=2496866 RepID=A0A3S9MWL8_9FLAO|nr:hypothetical protein [Nonlabens ponticola]AZQ43534.1 hypothetical protein EJ995_04530 [Nonlabens ponticola]